MANNYMVQLKGSFDYSQVTNGIKEIKKQISSIHLGDDIAKDLQKSLEKIEIKLPKIENFLGKDDLNSKQLENFQKLIKELQVDIDNFNKLTNEVDISGTFSKVDLTNLQNIDKQIKNIQDKIKTAQEELIKTFIDNSKFKVNSNSVQQALTELFTVKPEEIENKFNELENTFKTQLEEVETNLINMSETDFSKEKGGFIIEKLFGDETAVKIAKGKVTEFKKAFNDLLQQFKDLTPGSEEAKNKLQELMNLLKEYTNIEKTDKTLFNLPSLDDINNLDELKTYLKEIHDLIESKKDFFDETDKELLKAINERVKALEERMNDLEKRESSLKKESKNLSDRNKELDKAIEGVTEKTKAEENAQKALNDTFGSLAHRIESTISALAIFNKSMQIVRNAIKSVEDLDAAFTQIAIVSEQSGEAAWKMFDSFNSLAKQYSITTKDLTEGAKLFYQQGLNAADTMKMVEASTVSAALGEVTMTEAANTLTAAIQGYNESAAVAMDYTDKIAMVGAVSAADFNELSTAMEKTASSAYTAGIDFDHLLGYLGKMIEVTREAPANLGTAMKTIIARFEDMKKDPMAILEDGVSANKVEAALATIGIALRDSEGEFRALQDVMDELGIKWETLTRNQQAYIATVAAGSRQQSRFLAMMNNYDRTLDLIAESQNSAGAAARQYATYQDSIAAAQARLTASWENFYSKIVDNDLIKTAINGLSKIIDLLAKVPPSITAIGVTIGALQLQKYLTDNKGITGILKKMLLGDDLQKQAKTSAIGYIETFSTTSFSELRKKSPTIIGGFKSLGKNIGTALSSITSGFIGVGKAIAAFIAANWEIVAIAAVVGGAIAGINYLLNTQKREYEENIKKIQDYNEEAEKLTNRSTEGEDLIKKYEELSSKISLTEEEQQELNNTIQRISEIYPDAIEYIDQYGEHHLANVDILKQEVELERQLAQENTRAALQQRRKTLESPTKEWNKDDFSKNGISNKWSDLFFNSRDEEERLTKLKNSDSGWNNFLRGFLSLGLFSGLKPASFENEVKNLDNTLQYFYDNVEELSENDRAYATELINNVIDEFNLKVNKLSENSNDKAIQFAIEEIKKVRDNLDSNIEKAQKNQELAQKQMLKETDIAYAFSGLTYDVNRPEDMTAQKILSSQLQAIFQGMDIDIWELFFNNMGGSEGFTSALQAVIDNVDNENGIKLRELADKLTTGVITEEEMKEFYELLGLSAGEGFADGLQKALEGQEKRLHDEAVSAVSVKYEGKESGLDFSKLNTKELTSMASMPAEDYGLNAGQALYLAPYWEEYQKQLEEASKTGNFKGILDSIDQFENDPRISKNLQKAWYQMTRDGLDDAIAGYSDKLSAELQEAVNKVGSVMGKDYSSIDSAQAMDYASKYGSSFLNHMSMGEDGKYVLDDYAKIMVYENDINEARTEAEKKLKQLKIQLDAIENKDSEEAQNLENEIDAWEYILKLIKEIPNKYKKIVDLSDEIAESTKAYKKNLEEIGDTARDNAKALQFSSDIGKDYGDAVKVAKELEKQMKDIGSVSRDTMDELLALSPAFQDFFTIDSGQIYFELNGVVEQYQSAAEAVIDIARKQQKAQIEAKQIEMDNEIEYANARADAYEKLADLLDEYAHEVILNEHNMTDEERGQLKTRIENEIKSEEDGLLNAENTYNAQKEMANKLYEQLAQMDANYWSNLSKEGIQDAVREMYEGLGSIHASAQLSASSLIASGDVSEILKASDNYRKAAKSLRAYAKSLEEAKNRLKVIDPTIYEDLAEKMEKAGDAGTKAGEKIAKAIADAAEAIIKLNELIDKLKEELKDLDIDISPFTDLFEEWEHEWDYFYNRKTQISNIQRSRNMFSRISEAEWTSPEERMQADEAILGTYFADIAARRNYAEGLMAAIIQKGTDMTEKYGQFGTFDPNTMTWYQKDDQLKKINEEQAKRVENINDLQKEQWQKNNEVDFEEVKLEALEKQRDAHEDILSEIEDQIDSLKDRDDIEADLSALEERKKAEEDIIEGLNKEIDTQKDLIKDLQEELKKIDFDLWAEQDAFDFWDDYVSDMENSIDELNEMISEYYDNVDEMMNDVDELWEKYTEYIQAAIDVQNQLYNAVIEGYQKEIDQKKKQYDYLKQLDNDYLNSVKDNINKERQAREDANKQKSYQQNLQRAQLLQMDTSGAYRNELANLNKEIENQRQELYDDLVDKQVEALEKEIEKRHELYDKEVAALEERLAYMQENAILLWEMVDGIMAEGTEAVMAKLMETAEYTNKSELEKEQQRKTWENNVRKAVKTVTDDTVKQWGILAQVLGKIATETYPNYKEEAEENIEVLNEVTEAMGNYREAINIGTLNLNDTMNDLITALSTELNNYMIDWADATSTLTGNVGAYGEEVTKMIASVSTNIDTLDGWNSGLSTSGGKIIKTIEFYDQELADKYAEIYQDYEDERDKYRGELDTLIQQIQDEISAAIKDAAEAIRKAAESIQVGSGGNEDTNPGGNDTNPSNPGPSNPNPGGNEDEIKYNGWQVQYTLNGESKVYTQRIQGGATWDQIIAMYDSFVKQIRKTDPNSTFWGLKHLLTGGLVDFTGPAWLDGTKSKPEAVLNPKQTKLFESMVSSLERTANNSDINSLLGSSYNIGDINTTIQVEKLDNNTDIDRVARLVENKIMSTIKNRVVVSIK